VLMFEPLERNVFIFLRKTFFIPPTQKPKHM